MESQSKIQKKSTNGEDRLSNLPEHVIHRILSYLPETKDAARTSVLSKNWRHKWKEVLNLVFKVNNSSITKFSKSVDRALILYPNEKVEKFVIHMDCRICGFQSNPQNLPEWIRFATSKSAKEIILYLIPEYYSPSGNVRNFMLPQFCYNNTCLIKLNATHCDFSPIESIRWPSLKVLQIRYSNLTNEAVASILSGSPLLESLELDDCWNPSFDCLHIDSKHLKRLCLGWLCIHSGNSLKVSGSSVECLEIVGEPIFKDIVLDLPSLVTTTISIYYSGIRSYLKILQSLPQKVLILNAKESSINSSLEGMLLLVKKFQAMGRLHPVVDQTYRMSETKCIVIRVGSFLYYAPELVSLLLASPKLDRLVINFSERFEIEKFCSKDRFLQYYNLVKDYLMSQEEETFTNLTHLETIEISGISVCVCVK